MLAAEIAIVGVRMPGLMKKWVYALQKNPTAKLRKKATKADFMGMEGKSVSSQFSNVSFLI